MFGFVLLAVGVTAAGLVGTVSLAVAITTVVAVLLYDGFLKNTILAPFGMATCRFLNLLLGSSAGIAMFSEIPNSTGFMVAMPLGLYVFGVTLFAQNEAGKSSRILLYAGLIIALLGIVGDVLIVQVMPEEGNAPDGALIALGLIAAHVGFRTVRAIQSGQSIALQKNVGFMLLNIIFLDAAMTFACTGSSRLAALVVILVIPAMLSKRFIRMS